MNTPRASGRKPLVLRGKVTSGKGDGREYLQLPWVTSQIEGKLGFTPYPGTLNLTLDHDSTKQRVLLEEAEATQICPEEGYCVGLMFKAAIGGIECAVVLPKIKAYSKTLLEVIASINLRRALHLKDGDVATVTVNA